MSDYARIPSITYTLVQDTSDLDKYPWKDGVRAATNTDIALVGLLTIDDIVLDPGDRVLVKDQTLAEYNGIYVASSVAWTRSLDTNTSEKIKGTIAIVYQGTANGGNIFALQETNPILGVTPLTFLPFSGASGLLSLNGLTLNPQSFAIDSVGTDVGITSSGTVHTFHYPSASKTNRGLITTAAQSLTGLKEMYIYDANNAAVSEVLTLTHDLSNISAAGLGNRITFKTQTSTTPSSNSGFIDLIYSDPTHITRESLFKFWILDEGNFYNRFSATTAGIQTDSVQYKLMNSALVKLPDPGYTSLFFDNADSKLKKLTSAGFISTIGDGILSINGLNTAAQSLTIGTAGIAPAWNSLGTTHTLNIPSASLTAKGLITPNSQTIGGLKDFTINDANNNTTVETMKLTHNATLAAANGIGSRLSFYNKGTTSGIPDLTSALSSVYTDQALLNSELNLSVLNTGVLTSPLTVTNKGPAMKNTIYNMDVPGNIPTPNVGNMALFFDSADSGLKKKDSTGTVSPITGGSGGVTDHGLLTGLADDDHAQYHNDTRGDARYLSKTNITPYYPSGDFNPATVGYVSSQIKNYRYYVLDSNVALAGDAINTTITLAQAEHTIDYFNRIVIELNPGEYELSARVDLPSYFTLRGKAGYSSQVVLYPNTNLSYVVGCANNAFIENLTFFNRDLVSCSSVIRLLNTDYSYKSINNITIDYFNDGVLYEGTTRTWISNCTFRNMQWDCIRLEGAGEVIIDNITAQIPLVSEKYVISIRENLSVICSDLYASKFDEARNGFGINITSGITNGTYVFNKLKIRQGTKAIDFDGGGYDAYLNECDFIGLSQPIVKKNVSSRIMCNACLMNTDKIFNNENGPMLGYNIIPFPASSYYGPGINDFVGPVSCGTPYAPSSLWAGTGRARINVYDSLVILFNNTPPTPGEGVNITNNMYRDSTASSNVFDTYTCVYFLTERYYPSAIGIYCTTIPDGDYDDYTWEYWNGSTWTTLKILGVYNEYPYNRLNIDYLRTPLNNGIVNIRFGYNTSLPPALASAFSYGFHYMIRWRKITGLGAGGVMNAVLFYKDCSRFRPNGSLEYYGTGMPYVSINETYFTNALTSTETDIDSFKPVNSTNVYINKHITYGSISPHSYNFAAKIPDYIDSSQPIDITIMWFPNAALSINAVVWKLYVVVFCHNHIGALTSSELIDSITVLLDGSNSYSTTFSFSFQEKENDLSLGFKVERPLVAADTYEDDVYLLGFHINGYKWCH